MDNQNKFLLLSNLAIQMGLIITVGVFLGNYVDFKLNNQNQLIHPMITNHTQKWQKKKWQLNVLI